MISFNGYIFSKLDIFWKNLREFGYRNRTLFEVIFILVYTMEQAVLILYTYKARDPEQIVFITSLFALIVLMTFALHKIMMESRIRLLEEDLQGAFWSQKDFKEKANIVVKEYEMLKKSLNNGESK